MSSFRFTDSEQWEQFVSDSFYPLALTAAQPDFWARTRLAEMSRGIRVAQIETASSGLRRTPRLVASSPSDDLLFLVQVSGHAMIEQGGRTLELTAGQATYCDPTVPYSIVETHGHQIVTMVPRHEVLSPGSGSAEIRLRALALSLAPVRVFRLLAEDIATNPGSGHELEGTGVANAAAELLRSIAVLASTAVVDTRPWSHDTQLRAVKDYMLSRLSDPTVTMERIAAANGISVRQLSAIFAPSDSPAAFLRRERLRRAYADLRDPRFLGVAVADIAARWGYLDPSTFGRAFRREFDSTPSTVREQLMVALREPGGSSNGVD